MGMAILRVGVIPVPFRLAIGMAVCSGAGSKGIGVFSNVSLCVAVSLLRNHFIIALVMDSIAEVMPELPVKVTAVTTPAAFVS